MKGTEKGINGSFWEEVLAWRVKGQLINAATRAGQTHRAATISTAGEISIPKHDTFTLVIAILVY